MIYLPLLETKTLKMKQSIALILILLSTTFVFAQKKEKIKGSKVVTTKLRDISNFNNLEVSDNIEVFFEKGETSNLKIEADDNLHAFIEVTSFDNTLQLSTTKQITRFAKLVVRITYANDIKSIIAKDDAIVNAIQEITSDDIVIKSLDNSKLFMNVNARNFVLQTDNKSTVELNLKGENAKIVMSENARIKALVNVTDFGCDMYQKSQAKIEGSANSGIIRIDNNAQLTAEKLQIKDINISAEQSADCSVYADKEIVINASGRSEIRLYGSPKIELKQFDDEAKLLKKK
tara:strand:- start:476 stop:1345 length:870 start_codon:yes stop_codon:yes gene_type:complete